MSFMLTQPQCRARTKTVTRRQNWRQLKPGDIFHGVERCQGLKKGEKIVRLFRGRCVTNRREPLNAVTPDECVREGFPEMTPAQFVEFYCLHNKCKPEDEISRIEFEYLDDEPATADFGSVHL
jgi:hypothetical protein